MHKDDIRTCVETLGSGSCFVVRLPVEMVDAAAREVTAVAV